MSRILNDQDKGWCSSTASGYTKSSPLVRSTKNKNKKGGKKEKKTITFRKLILSTSVYNEVFFFVCCFEERKKVKTEEKEKPNDEGVVGIFTSRHC